MMKLSKSKSAFRCQECGYLSAKWLGKCPDCGKWNSLIEERQMEQPALPKGRLTDFSSEVSLISEIATHQFIRIGTGIGEFDRMIGGGLVPGSLVLLGGPPGIGKSTLVLQIAARLSKGMKVLYVSGEESQEQVKLRADRLGIDPTNLYLLSETNLENILASIDQLKPNFLIIDSIQTTYLSDFTSAPGSVSQIRECAGEFLRCAKSLKITVFLLGHVTKEGDLAGPRVLEHIVDTVLYFESESSQSYRILRAYKNRFGPTSEIGLFEMKSTGLEEVLNPSQIFLNEHHRSPGSVLVAPMEGSRPILLEIQALVSKSYYGLPRRTINSLDFNRSMLMIAVLEKRLNLSLSSQDVYLNVTGGAKIKETGIDLGIVCSIASAFGNFVCGSEGIFVGEVGLAGEVRSVSQTTERLKEAERLGLSWAVVPKKGLRNTNLKSPLKIVPVESVEEAVRWMRTDSV